MSGSYYALDTKYNSLLALVETLQADIISISQGLADVLTVSDDGGNQNMTNLNNVTVNNLNYTTLTPALPVIIGNIDQVLTTGNDAGGLDILNLDELEITLGGTGVTFPDGVTQTIAYTGGAVTDTLGDVMLNGATASTNLDMDANLITNCNELNNGLLASDLTIDSNQDLKLTASLGDVDIQSGAKIWSFDGAVVPDGAITFPDTTVQTTAFTGVAATPTLGAVMTVGNTASTTLDMGDIHAVTGLSALNGGAIGDMSIDSATAALNTFAETTTAITTNQTAAAQTWTFEQNGDLTFPDATVQSTAFTGTAATPSLGDVMTVSNTASTTLDMDSNSVLNCDNITATPSTPFSINSDFDLNLLTSAGYVKLVAGAGFATWQFADAIGMIFPDSTIQTTAYTGASPAAETLGDVMTNGNIASTDLDLDNNNIINLNNISGGVSSDITCTSSAFSTYFNAGVGVGINTNILGIPNSWVFNAAGGIVFPDLSVQTTAYQGSITGETLSSVLTNGNDATQQNMVNLGKIVGQNIGFTGGWSIGDNNPVGSSDVAIEGTVPNSTIFFKCADGAGTPITQLYLNTVGGGNAFGGALSMTDNYIEEISNLVCNDTEVVFTDDTEVRTGNHLTLMGTDLGAVSGNFVTAIGAGTGGVGAFANHAIGIGAAGTQGIGLAAIAIGQNAASGNTGAGDYSVAIGSAAAMGGSNSGAIAIGQNAAGVTDLQGTNAIAVGVSAGGDGQNGSSISIGTNAGKGTVAGTHQGTNSICIGNSAGFGWGAGGVPANSLTVSSIQEDDTNQSSLHYNTTTQEITYSNASGGTSYTQEIIYTGVSGSYINIPIPAGATRIDCAAIAKGGNAGTTNVFGSYYVFGGSGGGGGVVICYGVPLTGAGVAVSIDYYYDSATKENQVIVSGLVLPSQMIPFSLGIAYDGEEGGDGLSGGTGAAGAASTVGVVSNYPSANLQGTVGYAGGSGGFPTGSTPFPSPPSYGGHAEQYPTVPLPPSPTAGQLYSAVPTQAGTTGYNASTAPAAPRIRMTWYFD